MAKNAQKAMVVLNLTGDVPQIETSKNVRYISDVDESNLIVHFRVPFRDELYRCDVIPSEPVSYEIKARSKDGIGVKLATPWPRRVKIVCQQV
jgi:hypothetical protein